VRIRVGVLLLVAATTVACTSTVAGDPLPGGTVTKADPGTSGVDPSFVRNTDGGDMDRLAATVLTDVLGYWRQTFPATFGKDWTDLKGVYSVDAADETSPAPPCVRQASDVDGNAFYCASEDVIAWDRAALLPVLKEQFGEAAIMFVLAHEVGHAVQYRAGLTLAQRRANPDRFPTILTEAQADCYAGTFARWVVDGKAQHLRLAAEQRDAMLAAMITFRDPIGTDQTDQQAHGDAFDRVSAFQDGYEHGVRLCAEMSVDNRTFTLRGFLNVADAERGGNLPFEDFFPAIQPDLNTFFTAVAIERGKQWTNPTVRPVESNPRCAGDQGPAAFCPSGEIDVATKGTLPELHTDIGDYATGTILASRFGLAAMALLGKPLDGADAQRQVLCLAGAYTGTLLARQRGFALSPGDLDEAIQVLLRYDYPGRDTAGKAIPTGFERVSAFRAGTLQGVPACQL